jgi:hypothetical protein
MTQYQQVFEALEKLGGKATIKEILSNIDFNSWGTKTPENTVSRCLTTGDDFFKDDDFWVLKSNKNCGTDNGTVLYCSDGATATAIAEHSQDGWKIFGISQVFGFGNAEFKKILFNTTFDEIMPFNSMSGVSYVAVKKSSLWGLIRFRLNPEYAVYKGGFIKALGSEPIDENLTDPLGREIKFIEEIEYSDVEILIKKYKLDLKEEPRKWREWSDELEEYTRDAFSTLEFGFTPEETVRMKRSDGSFGFILLTDALKHKYSVHYDELESIESYSNVSEMVEAGWVLD